MKELIVFIFGACIGSFANVCIYRIPIKLSIIIPRSFCVQCRHPIPFYYNLPILSYIFLKGCCAFCKKKISPKYFIVELLLAVFALLLFNNFQLTLVTAYWFVFICVLIVISFIDIEHRIIPDIISLPCILLFSTSFYFLPEINIMDIIVGVLGGATILFSISFLYYHTRNQVGIGGGDIKLLMMIGAAQGIKGVLFTIVVGSLLGVIGSLLFIANKKTINLKLEIPFAPFLSMATILYIFYGNKIIQWYLN